MSYSKPSTLIGRVHTIIGAGTLGRRMALMWLTNGQKVHLFDTNKSTLEAASAYIKANLPSTINDINPHGREGELVTFANRKEALHSAWLVTEAIPEIKQAKIDLFGELDKELGSDVILATNSSSFMGSELFEKIEHKDRFLNTHYYMPPESNPVEIMPHAGTSAEIAPLIYEESKKHGLEPYLVRKESVGLIANRIWAAIKRESLFVVAEGIAKPEEVNSLLQTAFGVPVFSAIDKVGLDVARDIENHYITVRPDITRTDAAELLSKYIDEGKLGVKSGEGFFKYGEEVNPSHVTHSASATSTGERTLVYLNVGTNAIERIGVNAAPGSTGTTVLKAAGQTPDGIQVDKENKRGYWTVMGHPRHNDGRICSANYDGSDVKDVIPVGSTFTPKQCQLRGDTLYWCDREGGKVMSVKTDGSNLTTLLDSAPGEERPLADATKWCVGITVDVKRKLLYWTQKGPSKGGAGRLFRMRLETPQKWQLLLEDLPEPIDLELDESGETLYWTDRGDPPFGNTLNNIKVTSEFDADAKPAPHSDIKIILDHLHEPIGLVGDFTSGKMYIAELDGSILEVDINPGPGLTSRRSLLTSKGYFTGIALV